MPARQLVPASLLGRLARPRLVAPPFTVLVFDSGYHLQGEISRALTRLGHRVVTLAIGRGQSASTAMRALLAALLRHAPDLVVSINHIGFDAEGTMGQVLEEVEVPVAVWYVDSPLFIHQGLFLAAPRVTTVCCWEAAYLPLLAGLGALDVAHLPLAGDPERFAAAPPAAAAEVVLFVGSSLGPTAGPWWRQLSPAEAVASERAAADLAAGGDLVAHLGTPRPTPDARMTVLAQASLTATCRRRRAHLSALAGLPLCIAGDDGWRREMPAAARWPPFAYGPPLAAAYRQAAVNLNITSLQMPSAVNQRLFDVPLAGGFLLTDRQSDLAHLFAPGSVATYAGPDSLAEEARFFLARPRLRNRMAERARAQVLARHTYTHRARALIERVRQRWAAR